MTATSGGTVPVYPTQQILPCTETRFGEITFVIGTPKLAVVKGDADNRYLDDPNEHICFRAAWQYVGLSAEPILGLWQPAIQYTVALSRPSIRQRAAGQHWAACIVTLRPPDSRSTPTAKTPATPHYGTSIRDALNTGQQRNHLSTCIPAPDWNGDVNADACEAPHALEIMAFGESGDHPVIRTHLELTCQQLVRRLTGMADPLAAGALSIQMYVRGINTSGPITTPQVPAHSGISCGVTTTGNRKLRGSLLALGRQPVPWA